MPPLGWRKEGATGASSAAKATAVKKPLKKTTTDKTKPDKKLSKKDKETSTGTGQDTTGGKGKQKSSEAVEDSQLFLKQIKELEKGVDIAGLASGLKQFQAEPEIQFRVCTSLLKLLTVKDDGLHYRYMNIMIGDTDAGEEGEYVVLTVAAAAQLRESLILAVKEHGEGDEELQDAVFGVMNIIQDSPLRMIYKFFEKHNDPNSYSLLSTLKKSSDVRRTKRGIDPLTGRPLTAPPRA
mmetsp:Transcript_13003/g.18868  ORF Transcript_13003/g.18868 Transcript_13003/m.18868 type:complete len:238 (+) Transcript_13003:38-751(+)